MIIRIVPGSEEVGREAARFVASFLWRRPDAVLGLATGSTTIPFYQELVNIHQTDGLDFSRVVTFNLDEYYGVGPEDPRSYHYFMQEHFFHWVNINPDNIHLPDGLATDPGAECNRYEEAMAEAGGVDLQVLGIGVNGHIGFNEPFTALETETQLVRLHSETLKRNQTLAGTWVEPLPAQAISVGVKSIMHARQLLLLASGPEKARAVSKALEGAVTVEVPASVVQLHPALTVILDQAAAAKLS